jgi:hypothetical protein
VAEPWRYVPPNGSPLDGLAPTGDKAELERAVQRFVKGADGEGGRARNRGGPSRRLPCYLPEYGALSDLGNS